MAQTMATADVRVDRKWQLWIDGKFLDGAKERTLINPANGEPLCKVAEADKDQVELAIKTARAAFDKGPWRNCPLLSGLRSCSRWPTKSIIMQKNWLSSRH